MTSLAVTQEGLRAPVALTTPPRDRGTIAVHEAAHAIVALRTGTRFADIMLDPPLDPACQGILTLPDAPTFYALAVVLCAGLVIDLRTGHPIVGGAGCDMDELLHLADDLATETGRAPRPVMLGAFDEALRILRRQRAAVRRVTDALLVEGRLSYDDARRVAQLPGRRTT
jgi:hypothetical protein